MENTEINEGNRLIAKYVGIINLKEDRPELFQRDIFTIGIWKDEYESIKGIWRSPLDREYAVTEKLQFHSSWDWQIKPFSKVIKDIRKIGIADEEIRNPKLDKYFELKRKYSDAIFNNQPEEGFKILVEAVNWYNQILHPLPV